MEACFVCFTYFVFYDRNEKWWPRLSDQFSMVIGVIRDTMAKACRLLAYEPFTQCLYESWLNFARRYERIVASHSMTQAMLKQLAKDQDQMQRDYRPTEMIQAMHNDMALFIMHSTSMQRKDVLTNLKQTFHQCALSLSDCYVSGCPPLKGLVEEFRLLLLHGSKIADFVLSERFSGSRLAHAMKKTDSAAFSVVKLHANRLT